ncbi:hypothetical protein HS088_TW08G00265 [Tripterygium wilfordii]|uniref:Uncharacterized protein n=1 Tax=Tripterygium wilfordii TaxID=458696 RepID=A0A7J7DBF3_TRIWF|nr:hypothetical protein HS088_TW08G00265 [Tripterygium wilfordii]
MMECKKKNIHEDPTMEKKEEDRRKPKETEYKALHQQFMDLELEWDSIKCFKTMPKIFPSSPTTNSSCVVESLQLLDNSPGTLMSSLQQKRSPSSEREWKVRNNDLAIEEILRDRRAAIESGKLKARRLFDSLESATEIGLQVLVQESEVRSVMSYESDDDDEIENNGALERITQVFPPPSCSSLSSSSKFGGELEEGGELVMKGENVITSIEDRRGDVDDRGGGRHRRWSVVIDWLLIVCAVGIISMKIVNGCQDHKEVSSLVPT